MRISAATCFRAVRLCIAAAANTTLKLYGMVWYIVGFNVPTDTETRTYTVTSYFTSAKVELTPKVGVLTRTEISTNSLRTSMCL